MHSARAGAVPRSGTKRPRPAVPVPAAAPISHKRRRRRRRSASATSAETAEDEDEEASATPMALDPSAAHQQLLQRFATTRSQPVVTEATEPDDVERVTDSAAGGEGREEKEQADDDDEQTEQKQQRDGSELQAAERKEDADDEEQDEDAEEDGVETGAAEDDVDAREPDDHDDGDDEKADDALTASSSSSPHPELLSSDPFVSHFSRHRVLPAAVIAALSSSDAAANQLQPMPSFSTLKERLFGLNIHLLRDAEKQQETSSQSNREDAEQKGDEARAEGEGEPETAEAALSLPSASSPLHLRDLHVRQKVIAQWLPIAAKHRARQRRQQSRQQQAGSEPAPSDDDLPHPLHRVLFPLLSSYRDVVFSSVSPAARSSIAQCYCLHVVNHVVKSRERVLRHSAKLSEWRRRQQEREEQEREQRRRQREQDRLNNVPKQKRMKVHGKDTESELRPAASLPPPPSPPEYRDQGFTRCKVLILLPYANAAFTVISTILSLLPAASIQTVLNRKRFLNEFAPDPDVAPPDASRPADYRALFTGQLNDAFRIGISVGNSSVRLYSHFHASDIVVASPLGLRVITQDAAAAGEKKTAAAAAAADFLSSVELLVLDGADVLSMQNWAHVDAVLPLLNRLPVSDNAEHPTDFSRVRDYLLNGHSALYRQTLVFSRILNSDVAHLARHGLHNYSGLLLFRPSYSGQLQSVTLSAAAHRQIFQRFTASYLTQHDDRYAAFMDDILPAFRRAHEAEAHTLIFIPSYLDFVRLRNHFHARHLSYAAISEYTKTADLSRNRSNFFHGRVSFLLMTERFHFYRRYSIRGIRHVLFYQLPQTPDFYAEIVNMMGGEGAGAGGGGHRGGGQDAAAAPATRGMVLSLYCEFDGRELERVVGSQRAVKMLEGEKQTYMFS